MSESQVIAPQANSNQAPWWVWPLVALIVAFGGMAFTLGGLYLYLSAPVKAVETDTQRPSQSVNLASLVVEEDDRRKLASYFGDFSTTIRVPECSIKTTGQFREAYRTSVNHYKGVGKLPDLEAIDKPISDMIATAIGLEDQPLDGKIPLRQSLANVLEDVSKNVGR